MTTTTTNIHAPEMDAEADDDVGVDYTSYLRELARVLTAEARRNPDLPRHREFPNDVGAIDELLEEAPLNVWEVAFLRDIANYRLLTAPQWTKLYGTTMKYGTTKPQVYYGGLGTMIYRAVVCHYK